VRISLANLPETAYPAIAKAVHTVLDELHSSHVSSVVRKTSPQEEAR
jgi:hypothetical protein